MTYTGAMVLPQNAVVLQEEEMRYLEGGKKVTRTQKASSLIKYTGKMMAAWASLAGGYTYSAAAAAASGIGVGVSAICGLGAGYCALITNCIIIKAQQNASLLKYYYVVLLQLVFL